MKIPSLLKNARVLILIIILLLAVVAINPRPWNEGAAIRSVGVDSAAADAGILGSTSGTTPVARERVIKLNSVEVHDAAEYYAALEQVLALGPNTTFTLTTNKDIYRLTTAALTETIVLNETEWVNQTTEVFDEELNATINVTELVEVNKTEELVLGVAPIGLKVYDAPKTNIRLGLDLSGGTRVILQPAEPVSGADMDLIVENIEQRLNVFGLSDLSVRVASDLSGDEFIIVEIAGADDDEVRTLLSQQGKFEARIANATVFRGENDDITYVCRSADCAGLDPYQACGATGDGSIACRFRFSIKLSQQAAEAMAAATRDLELVVDEGGSYLSQPIELYLDGELVDSLNIASDLQGKVVTDIQISGGGNGRTQIDAVEDTLNQMRHLQTVLITGSLPVELEVVKSDVVSPTLGKEFLKNAMLVGLVAILVVSLLIVLRYRRIGIALPVIITMLSEAVAILGFASLVGWNLDLAAIAAVIIAIGTGVDSQIVIADETIHGESEAGLSWKEKMKRAFFIIMASYVTTVAAMVPLWFAGAGMLRGFAITTIIGISIGVFVTRPAFGVMVQHLVRRDEE